MGHSENSATLDEEQKKTGQVCTTVQVALAEFFFFIPRETQNCKMNI